MIQGYTFRTSAAAAAVALMLATPVAAPAAAHEDAGPTINIKERGTASETAVPAGENGAQDTIGRQQQLLDQQQTLLNEQQKRFLEEQERRLLEEKAKAAPGQAGGTTALPRPLYPFGPPRTIRPTGHPTTIGSTLGRFRR